MFSRISPCKDGASSIEYCEGKGHNGNAQRNLLVTPINMIPNLPYAKQMEVYWKKARKNHKVQTRRIVVSFSKKELNPNNPEHIEIANEICKTFVKKYYKDRQAVIFLQADGKGKCLHAHIIVNDISMSPPHRGCSKQQQYFYYVRKGIDEVASKYFKLDPGAKTKSKETQTERALKDNDKYSYISDLKQRILNAVEHTSNEKDFILALEKDGVEVKKKPSKKYGSYYLYNFVGAPIKNIHTKIRSLKLGYSFGPGAIKEYWAEKNVVQSSSPKEDAFLSWLREKDESYFIFSKSGQLLSTDFEKRERLHEQFELELKTKKEPPKKEIESSDSSEKNELKKEDKQSIINTTVLQSIMNDDDDDDRDKELTYRRYQRAKEELPIDYSSVQKTKDFSL